jgi:hypothetical protein
MMLKVIEDASTVKKYRRQFVKSFKSFVDEKIQAHLGHPGGVFKANVFWSNRYGIWVFHEKIWGNRCGHAFGLEKPAGKSPLSITCGINFPCQGIDRRMGGALAEDRRGRIFVVHRGKIGGGKKGVGKSLFEKYYRGAWTDMEDGAVVSTVAVVGLLHSPRFVRQAVQFIRKVSIMKDALSHRSSQMEIVFAEPHFREELIGDGHDRSEWNTDSDCDHGLVVTDLQAALKEKGALVGNDTTYDLFIINTKGRLTTVFQVLTDHSAAFLYSAMSKLLLNCVELPDKPRLVVAVPSGIEQALAEKMQKVGVAILEYKWQEDQAVFPLLSAFFPH